MTTRTRKHRKDHNHGKNGYIAGNPRFNDTGFSAAHPKRSSLYWKRLARAERRSTGAEMAGV